jgi:pimeloyl-ACP methyl ester carboxylesterase
MLLEQTPHWLTSVFSAPGWHEAVAAYYEQALRRMSVRCETHMIATDYGETHILAAGRHDAPPIVLIHGRAVNATVWGDYIAEFSHDHRVYAIDVVGEGGKSASRHPFTWSLGYAAWLCQVFDGLGLQQAHVMGMSFGGWLALKLAIHAPQRVRKLTLLAPGGFVWARLPFVARGMRAALLPNPQRTRRFVEFLSAPGTALDEGDWDLLHMVFEYHHTNPEPPPPFTDGHLRRLKLPVQLLIGEHDHVFAPHAVVKRARSLLPNLVESTILPHVGHGILRDRPDLIREHLGTFLKET